MKFTLKNSTFLAIFFALFFACTQEKKEELSGLILKGVTYDPTKVDTIRIDVESLLASQENMDFVPENVEVIPLETKEECLIGDIDKVFFDGERFYVFDYLIAKKLFVFDRNGKFLFEVGKQGHGPGEYTGIVNFMVYPERELVEILSDGHKILYFHSKTGQFMEEKRYNPVLYPRGMAYVDNAHLALYAGYFLGPEYFEHAPEIAKLDIRYNLLVMEPDLFNIGQRAYGYDDIRYTRGMSLSPFGVFTGFYYYQDTLTFAPPCENYISRVTPEGTFARYFIDFGKHAVPDEYWEGKNFLDVYQEFAQSDYLGFIERVLETPDFLNFTLFYRKTNRFRVVYSKKHGKVLMGFDSENPEMHFGELLAVHQDKIISYVQSNWSMYNKEKLAKEELDITEKNSAYIQYLREVESGDNPAILLYNIKFLE